MAFLEQLPKASVTYERTCVGAASGSSKVKLQFSDGTDTQCDLLIIADGSSSKLRAKLRPEEQKGYLGICMISVRAQFQLFWFC